MVMATPTVQVRDTIELDETEEKIFKRLLGTLDHFGLETELRVAGGWVRDKVCIGELLVGGKSLISGETKNLSLNIVCFGYAASGKRVQGHRHCFGKYDGQ